MGTQGCFGESLKTSYNQYAATDEVRARDFQQMLDNPSIKAIFSARGGYGSARILDQINFDAFLETPKWLIGSLILRRCFVMLFVWVSKVSMA
jgi:muramoyltetrapeptide carboxypeptidase